MRQYDRYVIVTEEEMELLHRKAWEVYSYKDAAKIDLKKRLPYYIPTYSDFTKSGIPFSAMLPYYIFITEKTEDGKYMYEGHNEDFNNMRRKLEERYNPRIIKVASAGDMDAAIEKIKKMEMLQEARQEVNYG